MLLEVPGMAALVGRDVALGERFRLWDLVEGRVASYFKQTGLFRELAAYPVGATPREIAEGNHRFDFYQIGLSGCRYHGKPVEACPVFVIGHDLDTDQIGLVTFPFGFAVFERRAASPAASTPPPDALK